MKRLFTAIKIQPSQSLEDTYNHLRNELKHDRITWIDIRNAHITLKFFGETEESRIAGIREAMSTASLNSQRFELNLRRTGIFGSRYDPKVIWFGIDPEPGLELLWENLKNDLQKKGWEPDRQNFVPHLTIGRVKKVEDKEYFQQLIGNYRDVHLHSETIDRIILYESILGKDGPKYSELFSCPLK